MPTTGQNANFHIAGNGLLDGWLAANNAIRVGGIWDTGINAGAVREDVLLGLAGRVPVKVSNENGAIRPGDLLAPSSVPGVAMRATGPGAVVGIALEAFDGRTPRGQVLCFVKPARATSPRSCRRSPPTTTR